LSSRLSICSASCRCYTVPLFGSNGGPFASVDRHLPSDRLKGWAMRQLRTSRARLRTVGGQPPAPASPGDRPARGSARCRPEEPARVGARSAAVASVSARATAGGDSSYMDQKSIAKARWARAKAASLWQQADALDLERGGDWRDRARRRRVADQLRTEAARLDCLARRFDPMSDDEAA